MFERGKDGKRLKRKAEEGTEQGVGEKDGGFLMRKIHWKAQLIKSLKIAVAAFASIALAGEIGLNYSSTAGIITILSIRNTKRETLKSAANRGLAFLCALVLSAVCFRLIGYNLWAFAVYLLLFSFFVLSVGWGDALANSSVLVSHILAEQSMGLSEVANETMLFLIGTGAGILVNLHLHKNQMEFDKLAGEVDAQIKQILHRMSHYLPREDKSEYGSGCFERLDRALDAAKACAAANYNNVMLPGDSQELDYIEMREKQSVILREVYDNIVRIQYLPEQALQVAELLGQIEQDYHRENTVEGLLEKLEALLLQMKEQRLPQSREEFEARAILFYILMQIRNLLELKREFWRNLHG